MSILDPISKNGRIFMLAYDQGIEHGPKDFNDRNYDPKFIFEIALNSDVSCVAMQYGNAKRHYTKEISEKMPLVLKLNGKTALNSSNYMSALLADVDDAVALGAKAIGFTIFPGQISEHVQFEQFSAIRRHAEQHNIATILWSYARGPEIEDQHDQKVVAYAVRSAAELGADAVKVKYTGTVESFVWAAKIGGGIDVLASGTDNFPEDYVGEVAQLVRNGIKGIAVGRKVWQDENPVLFAKDISKVIYS
ncbi:MAG: class I fructose-bisphosphate aldolase [Candidatus Dojkabacteria bacterium]